MSTTPISPTSPQVTDTNSAGTAPTGGNSLDVNEFMNLLMTELENQDPTSPMDDTQFMSQMAQFSSLQQTAAMNTTMTNMAGLDQITGLSNLIGKTVTTSVTDSSGNPVGGVVSAVSVQSGTAVLTVDGSSVPVSSITGVQATTS